VDDTTAIERLLVRYATAIDTRDWALLRTCFADGLRADYGDIGTWTSAEELVAFMDAAHVGFGATHHMLTNIVVAVDGERATSRCYVHAVLVLADDPGTWFDTIGQYDDVLTRTADGWRIAERTFRATRMTSGSA
jgi:3-phenylpropionate/cinnamic acid dioxygenase small subunit